MANVAFRARVSRTALGGALTGVCVLGCDGGPGRSADTGADRESGAGGQSVVELSATCSRDLDCWDGRDGPPRFCQTRTGVCVECRVDAQCDDLNLRCEDGRCVANTCNTDSECSETGLCYEGRCVSCTPDRPCSRESECLLGLCLAPGFCGIVRGHLVPCCEPSSVACEDEQWLIVCSERGSIAERRDCSADGLRCLGGECVGSACDPGKTYCADGAVQRCSPDGMDSTLLEDCGNDVCKGDRCVPRVCEPNQRTCISDSIATCSDDGTAYLINSIETCPGEICRDAQCVTLGPAMP
jgi:hypothetical protein